MKNNLTNFKILGRIVGMKNKILDFLYTQVSKNNISHIRKGMVEEFESFILGLIAETESLKYADKMRVKSENYGELEDEDKDLAQG